MNEDLKDESESFEVKVTDNSTNGSTECHRSSNPVSQRETDLEKMYLASVGEGKRLKQQICDAMEANSKQYRENFALLETLAALLQATKVDLEQNLKRINDLSAEVNCLISQMSETAGSQVVEYDALLRMLKEGPVPSLVLPQKPSNPGALGQPGNQLKTGFHSVTGLDSARAQAVVGYGDGIVFSENPAELGETKPRRVFEGKRERLSRLSIVKQSSFSNFDKIEESKQNESSFGSSQENKATLSSFVDSKVLLKKQDTQLSHYLETQRSGPSNKSLHLSKDSELIKKMPVMPNIHNRPAQPQQAHHKIAIKVKNNIELNSKASNIMTANITGLISKEFEKSLKSADDSVGASRSRLSSKETSFERAVTSKALKIPEKWTNSNNKEDASNDKQSKVEPNQLSKKPLDIDEGKLTSSLESCPTRPSTSATVLNASSSNRPQCGYTPKPSILSHENDKESYKKSSSRAVELSSKSRDEIKVRSRESNTFIQEEEGGDSRKQKRSAHAGTSQRRSSTDSRDARASTSSVEHSSAEQGGKKFHDNRLSKRDPEVPGSKRRKIFELLFGKDSPEKKKEGCSKESTLKIGSDAGRKNLREEIDIMTNSGIEVAPPGKGVRRSPRKSPGKTTSSLRPDPAGSSMPFPPTAKPELLVSKRNCLTQRDKIDFSARSTISEILRGNLITSGSTYLSLPAPDCELTGKSTDIKETQCMSEISKKSASSHDEDSVPSTSRTNTIYSEQPPGGVVKKHYDLDKMVNLITSENFPKEVMVSPGKHTPGPISEDVVAMMDISANTVAATSTTSPLSEKNDNVSLTEETLTDNKYCETLAKKRKNDLNYHSGKEEEKNKKARLFSESKGSCSVSSSKKKKKKKKKESRDENENTDTKKDKKEKKEKKAKKDKKNSSTGRRQTAFSHVSNHPVIHIVHGSMLEDSL